MTLWLFVIYPAFAYMLDAKGYYLLAWTVLAVDAGRGSVLRKPHSVVKTTFKRICLLIVYYSN